MALKLVWRFVSTVSKEGPEVSIQNGVCEEVDQRIQSININKPVVERFESFKFLGVHITNKLSWSKHSLDSCEEGTTKPFPPQETGNIWHGSPDPQSSTAAPLTAF
jgi:hypothetical protein